jgi:hypothetical protein
MVSMALLAVGVAAVARNPMWLDRSGLDRYHVEGAVMLTGSPELPLLRPIGPPWFYTCLGRLRARLCGTPSPTVCYDVCACTAAGVYRTGLEFASGRLSEVPLDPSGCRFRAAPLTAEFAYELSGTTSTTWASLRPSRRRGSTRSTSPRPRASGSASCRPTAGPRNRRRFSSSRPQRGLEASSASSGRPTNHRGQPFPRARSCSPGRRKTEGAP